MNVSLPGSQSRLKRRLSTVILIGLVGLIAIYPLTGCASLGGSPGAVPTPVIGPSIAATLTTVVATPVTTTHHSQTSLWKLVWSDEFNGPQGAPPDPNKWTPEIGGEGWGNQQLEYDTNNKNAYQDGQGHLVLEARKNDAVKYQCWYGPCQYTSAHITTSGHFSFTYGLLEASIKIPSGQGIWSAFWLLGNNCATVGWPTCGEIDVMENVGNEPDLIYGTVHGPGDFSGTYKLQHGAFSDNFHVFALQWDPNHLYFFIDGINYYTVDRTTLTNQADWVYDHPFSIILNVPVGGVWPGSPDSTTVFPQKMYVSYLRLYKNG
jgi:beta-glucanase (GH16 family)